MTSAFIIRFHYAKEDPRVEWRFAYFVKEVLPRIKAQTVQGFDICIRTSPWHKEMFEQLGLKTFSVTDEAAKYKTLNGKQYFYDFVPFSDVYGLEKYDVQMGLDSDDLVEPRYVETIMDTIREFTALMSEDKSLHISFQPSTVNIRNGKRVVGQMPPYSPTKGSAFFALYQPNKENYVFAYCGSHLTLWEHADHSVTLPVGYCMATIHDINESTGK